MLKTIDKHVSLQLDIYSLEHETHGQLQLDIRGLIQFVEIFNGHSKFYSIFKIGYDGGFSNVNFNNITIDGTGKDAITTSRFSQPHDGTAIFVYTSNGSANFTNLTLKNIEASNPYLVQNGFNLNIK